MARFEINGKEYELKLTFASIKHLNGLYQGGSLELLGKAIAGDLDTFTRIIHAGLFHTDENFSYKAVEEAIEQAFEAEKLDLDYVLKTSNEVVAESFFYKKLMAKLVAKNPEAMEQMAELLK